MRLPRAHALAQDGEALRLGRSRELHQAVDRAPGERHAEAHLGEADERVLRGDAPVAGERERAAAADRVALDRGERHLRDRLPRRAQAVAGVRDAALLGERLRAHVPASGLAQIGAGAEVVRPAGEDDRAHLVAQVALEGELGELVHQRERERVALARSVQPHDEDAVARFEQEVLVHVASPGWRRAIIGRKRAARAARGARRVAATISHSFTFACGNLA